MTRPALPGVVLGAAVLLLLAQAATAQTPSAAQWFRGGTAMFTVQAGGAAFTDFQRGTARSATGDAELHDFRRRVSAQTTATVGAWLGVWLNEIWGVRGGVAYSPSSFKVWNEQSAQTVLDARGSDADPEYASLNIFLADVSLMFRFPSYFGRAVAYGIAGGGVIRYTTSGGALPPEARDLFHRGPHHALAGVVGLGAAIPLRQRSLLLTFELTDHISRTPLDDAGSGESFQLAGVPLQLEPEGTRNGTDGVGLTNTVRLVVGATIPIR